MRVKIGEYPSRLICNIHTRHMQKKYEGLSYDNQTREDYVLEAIEDAVQSVYNVFNWLWYDRRTQKVKVQTDRWDTWSMDHTLAHIVLPMLVQLKRTKHGAHCTDDKDVPKELRSTSAPTKKNTWDTDDNHFKRWDWILDEMIWAFHQKCRDDWEGDFYEYKDDDTERFGLKLVWEDRAGQKAHQERMTNGFKLFGKYYENLWD
jgi:hypothetical protein|tara:strand:+ start:5957 stop:6568 length:612 start_codon:yes stop_codon:yes gene_type:complete